MRKAIVVLGALMLGWSCAAADSSSRPPVTGIAYVKFKTTDVDKADAFYGGILGMRGDSGSCKGVAKPCYEVNPNQHIELVRTDSDDKGSLLVEVGIRTSDAAQMLGYLTSHGVVASEIRQKPNGTRYFEVRDPEGNLIVFVEAQKTAAQANAPQSGRQMMHAGVIVKDRAQMDGLYQDILGFRLYWHGGMKEDRTDWADMQVPQGTDWIEYMLNVSANPDKHTRGVMYHIALGVPSVQVAAKEFETKGIKLPEAPKIGKDGKWQLNLYDPDQTRVELMEFAPVEKPCCAEYTGPHPKP
jgi:catechol 2,3-dioxygenase-like lactoylglutathione lyase family enzyme